MTSDQEYITKSIHICDFYGNTEVIYFSPLTSTLFFSLLKIDGYRFMCSIYSKEIKNFLHEAYDN